MSNEKYARLLNRLQTTLRDKYAPNDLVESIKRKITKIENERKVKKK